LVVGAREGGKGMGKRPERIQDGVNAGPMPAGGALLTAK